MASDGEIGVSGSEKQRVLQIVHATAEADDCRGQAGRGGGSAQLANAMKRSVQGPERALERSVCMFVVSDEAVDSHVQG